MQKISKGFILTVLVAVLSSLMIWNTANAFDYSAEMPIVYVDPPNAGAPIGTTFNVSVKVFNLTNNFFASDQIWEPGQALPKRGALFNYSLGNMYGFNIHFSWDTSVLEYVRRIVKIPVETYPDGVLHAPIAEIQDEVNLTSGDFNVFLMSGLYPIEGFNCPNKSATMFTLTFKVRSSQLASFRLESVELFTFQSGILGVIPHWILYGRFTPAKTAQISGIDIGVMIDSALFVPVISGENVTISVSLENNSSETSSYNLSIFYKTTLLSKWILENLSSNGKTSYNCTLPTQFLEPGIHTITAKAVISYYETEILDQYTKEFNIIYTPKLSIRKSLNEIKKNDTVTLIASDSYHQNPNSRILAYTWTIQKLGDSTIYTYEGVNATHRFSENGTWGVILVVMDNWGVTFDEERNATDPYRKEIFLGVPTENNSTEDGSEIEKNSIPIAIVAFIIIAIFLSYFTKRSTIEISL